MTPTLGLDHKVASHMIANLQARIAELEVENKELREQDWNAGMNRLHARIAEYEVAAGAGRTMTPTHEQTIAKIVVPCLLPTGDEGKCTVATLDQFGPSLAKKFIEELAAAGFQIVPIATPEQIEAAAMTFSSSSWNTLSPEAQHRFREKAISALTAAAGVGDTDKNALIERCKKLTKDRAEIEAATIERCAQVAAKYDEREPICSLIAAAIRALKSESKP